MQKIKKILLVTTLLMALPFVLLAAPSSHFDVSILPQTTLTFDLGSALKVWNNLYVHQICFDADTCRTTWPTGGGGGGSGGGTFATTTSLVSGQLLNYPLNTTDIVTIGSLTATSSAKFWFDPNLLLGKFNGSSLWVTASTTLANLTFNNATGSQATTTNIFSTSGTFTNLFGTNITGFGLASCSGTSALTFSGTTFGCAAQPQGTITALTGDVTASGNGSVAATLATVNGNVGSFTNANITVNAKGLITAASNGSASSASSTLLADNNGFSGLNTFTDLKLVTRSTTTNATTTNLFSTTASSTNLFTSNFGVGSSTPMAPVVFSQSSGLLNPVFIIDGVYGNASAEMALNRASGANKEANIDFNTNGVEKWQLGMQDRNPASDDFEFWDGADNPIWAVSAANNDFMIGTTTGYAELTVWGDAGTGNIVQFATAASTTAFVVTNGGNVGIGGTTTPYAPLSISQASGLLTTAVVIDGVANSAGAEMAFNRANTGSTEANIDFNTAGAEFWQLGLQNNSSNDFELWDGNDNPAFTIKTATNNTGIGTTSPYARLTAWGAGTGNEKVFEVSNNASTSEFSVTDAGLTSLVNLLASGSSTLQNFTARNATTTQATTTNLSVGTLFRSGTTDGCGTWAGGILGSTGSACGSGGGSAYPFPLAGNATSSTVGFNLGLIGTGSSTIANLSMTTATATSATTTNLAITSTLSKLLLTDGNGVVSGYAAQACTNQFVRGLSALGVPTCATVGSADVSLANLSATDATLTFSGTYTGTTARTIGLNLGNANTWTALQTFSNANALLATGSSTLQNFTGVNATTTNATSTTFYATTLGAISASSTNATSTSYALTGISNVLSNGIYSSAANAIDFSTASTWRGGWDSLGRFDIGTSTPTWTFTVASTSPTWELDDTNGATNQKHFIQTFDGGKYSWATSSDTSSFATSSAFFSLDTTQPTSFTLGTTTIQESALFEAIGSSDGSATKGTCFRAKDVGANTFTYWWFKAGVQTVQTTSCSGTGTTTIIYQ